jgi:hypothetical protein
MTLHSDTLFPTKCTFLLDSFDIRSYIHLKSEKIKKKYENEQRKSEHHTLPISQLSEPPLTLGY